MEPFDTNEQVYTSDKRTETYTAYNVEVGNEFRVLCASTGTFSGEVTWMNRGKNSV